MATYRMVTTWRVAAPREKVWKVLDASEAYPDWWPGFERAEVLEPGGPDGEGRRVRARVRSRLPYPLDFEVVGRGSRPPSLITLEAAGDLDGIGRWALVEDDGVTTATYTWEVATTRPLMRLLAPVARPVFIFNHHLIMRWGAEGLARRVGARLLGREEEPHLRPGDWAPLVALLLAPVGVIALLRRAGGRA